MARPALTDTITRIAEPVVASLGLEIWGLEILQGGRPVVRLYVDVPQAVGAQAATAAVQQEDAAQPALFAEPVSSVSIDQCARISRMVGLALEVEEAFDSAYVLEVSSPGLSRVFFRLDQLRSHVDETVDVVLHESPSPQWLGRKKFRGRLVCVGDDSLTLAVETGAEAVEPEGGAQLTVRWEDVRKANRVHVFHEPEKPGKKRAAK